MMWLNGLKRLAVIWARIAKLRIQNVLNRLMSLIS